jgi:hypothetical protein
MNQPVVNPSRVFLLSPANCRGRRAQLLIDSDALPLALQLRSAEGAPIGAVFSFISSLYFRGKLAYAEAFGGGRVYVISPDRGLLPPHARVTRDVLVEFAAVPIDAGEPRYREPLVRDLARAAGEHPGPIVLLGSIASHKYVAPMIELLGPRLLFPSTFVGRGDMSRGGVLLRAARAGVELEYEAVAGAILRGRRPPRLEPEPRQARG